MGVLDAYKPAMAMVGLQFIYAGVSLSARAALLQGMSPRVFVVYRQAVATLFIAPIAYFSRRNTNRCYLGWRSFGLIFFASLFGITANQNLYFEGLYLASSSTASAMINLIPAVTFVMASIVGLEKVDFRSLRGIVKIIGTFMCVGGAIIMALLRGPKLLNGELQSTKLALGSGAENWLLGCLFLFGSSSCWSIWLILQVPVCASYPDHLSLSAWMCLMATLQSATIELFTEIDRDAWILHTYIELGCCFYSGVLGSGLTIFAQAWCISKRGPLFSAMFNPLCTVIVTIFAAIFLHEEIYTGSLVGAFGVIIGLYVVLWSKARDLEEFNGNRNLSSQNDQPNIAQVLIDEPSVKTACNNGLEDPLLCKG
ncbi:unnamed protein product [Ilex paraguariensis]|uniref:WAT1-related protein n=1 Tax=Ilex paraguariensis TaxID=185542 RepID=A0ABC8RC85_9AQUA